MKNTLYSRPEDRKFLVGILGEDVVKKLETDATARGKALEDAGIRFKDNDPDEVPSSELALLVAAQSKLFTDVIDVVAATGEAVKEAANINAASDTRLGAIETKLERTNQILLMLLAPQHASKSIFTFLTPEEKEQFEKLQQTDDKGGENKKPTAGKSLLEQLAEAAGG